MKTNRIQIGLGRLYLLAIASLAARSMAAPAQLTALPQQAVIFDGSTAGNSVSIVAFSSTGYLREIKRVTTCENPELPPRIVVTTQSGPGLTFGGDAPAMSGYDFPLLGPGPFPGSLENDCDMLQSFRAVDTWVGNAYATAGILFENAVNCHQDHLKTHCQILKAVTSATLLPGTDPTSWSAWIAPAPPNPGISVTDPCERALGYLYRLNGTLDTLFFWNGQCNAVGLPATLQQALSKIVNQGRLTQPQKEALINQADDQLAQSQFFLEKVQSSFAFIQSYKEQLTIEAIKTACAECNGSAVPGPAGRDQAQEENQPSIKERLLRGFAQALRGETDRVDAQRLLALIHRLEETPDKRILHVAYPTTGAISEFHVAFSPPCALGERNGPLVVILEALNKEAQLPEMTEDQERTLFRAFAIFGNTLRLNPPTPVRSK